MPNCIVRIRKIEIRHLKNIKRGEIKFKNYSKLKKNMKLEKGDMLGVYGPNGSGKSAVVDACVVLQALLLGQPIPDRIAHAIAMDKSYAKLGFEFFVWIQDTKYIVNYEVGIARDKQGEKVKVIGERLSYRVFNEGKWKNKSILMEYNSFEEDHCKIAPRYKKVIGEDSRLLMETPYTSFIFGEETRQVFREKLGIKNPLVEIMRVFYQFAYFKLFVIAQDNIGIMERLFNMSLIPENRYEAFTMRIKQMDKVLEMLIPGLNLEIDRQGESSSPQVVTIRQGIRVPLKHESEGIQRIVIILSVLIAVYNKPSICMVIDDLDNRIFGPLLNQFIELFKSEMEGQLIFTAGSLGTLEKLDKDHVVFADFNEENSYIYLESTSHKKNFREICVKELHLEQPEGLLGESTDKSRLHTVLRDAGKMHEVVK